MLLLSEKGLQIAVCFMIPLFLLYYL